MREYIYFRLCCRYYYSSLRGAPLVVDEPISPGRIFLSRQELPYSLFTYRVFAHTHGAD